MSTLPLLPPGFQLPAFVREVALRQHEATIRWHLEHASEPKPNSILSETVLDQHRRNFDLWHEEDKARAPNATEAQITTVKRAIDKLNQERNDRVERLDEIILSICTHIHAKVAPNARWNTESPGTAIDRLSILSLKVFHMKEQEDRSDASDDHRAKCKTKRETLERQREDLAIALQELLDDLFAGRKQMKVYRQFKMYNDPTLNPAIYKAK
jgi:hypothetical protein